MNPKTAFGPGPAPVSRRSGLRSLGALGIGLAALLFLPGPAPAGTKKPKVFSLELRHGKVPAAQRTLRVTEGDRVELRWTADEAVELHLHGYNVRLALSPGAPASMAFDAHTAGRFPVGIHGSGGHGHGNVVYLEVHPR